MTLESEKHDGLFRGVTRCDKAAVSLAALATLLHLVTANGYGIFRDELYYLACASHLDWGFVDHPPLVALMARLIRNTIGTSLPALRFVPALAAGVLVLLTAATARQFGGRRYAQLVAGTAVALAPQYLGMLSIFSMNAADLVLWAALLLVTVHILRTGERRLWVAVGVLAGVGLQNKLSMMFLLFGLAVSLIVSRRWQDLRARQLWIGAGAAAILFAPHIVWQFAHDWPTLEFIRRATALKNIAYHPLTYIVEQTKMMNPVALPLWLAGLGALILARSFRLFRPIGWTFLAVLLLLLTRGAKPYYLAPMYPPLLAAGAVVLERTTQWPGGKWIRGAALTVLVLSGMLLAPFAKPLLPVDRYVTYAAAAGVAPGTDERHELGRLPQFFADMHGWEDLANAVAAVHRALPAEDQDRACVFAQNYGQAGAIDYFGAALGIPPAMSGHNSYWLWGPGSCDGAVVIMIGGERSDHLQSFEEVTAGGEFTCRNSMPYENNLTLWIARRLKAPIADAWPRVKHFD